MDRVPSAVWRLGVLALLLTLLVGAGLALALANGLADPPRARERVFQADSIDELLSVGTEAGVMLYALPDVPASTFTLEADASNGSGEGAAWGVWVRSDGRVRVLLVDNRGYLLTTLVTPNLEWRAFDPIRPPRSQVYIHVQAGEVTFRINQEFVTTVGVERIDAVGLALYADPRLDWHGINLWADVNAG